MKNSIYFEDFRSAWSNSDRANSFSYESLKALYSYLIELEEACDIEIELDIIALDCDFIEYDSLEEVLEDYNIKSLRELEENTTVIRVGSEGLIIQAF